VEYSFFKLTLSPAYSDIIAPTLKMGGTPKENATSKLKIQSPEEGTVIESPLMVDGEAVGDWYKEGSFIVELQDSEGNKITEGKAMSIGDFMTKDYVPFNARLEFEGTEAEAGFLVFKSENGSGEERRAVKLK